MGPTVILISGPAGSGKSHLIGLIAEQAAPVRCWYMRIVDGRRRDVQENGAIDSKAFLGVRYLRYAPDRVFELLPEALRQLEPADKRSIVLLEADTNPALRHAFPYDYQLFVLPAPRDLHEVFRSRDQATAAMKQVMQDTASFAAEVFGLLDAQALAEDPQVEPLKCPGWYPGESAPMDDVDRGKLDKFLSSPLGAEIASRIQLQPAYHALIESDVVVINMGARALAPAAEACRERIEGMLSRLQSLGQHRTRLFCCDPFNERDPIRPELLGQLARLASAAQV